VQVHRRLLPTTVPCCRLILPSKQGSRKFQNPGLLQLPLRLAQQRRRLCSLLRNRCVDNSAAGVRCFRACWCTAVCAFLLLLLLLAVALPLLLLLLLLPTPDPGLDCGCC
jgi:hypothetical protein